MAEQREMYFFFGSGHPFSNWYMRDFMVKGIRFCCNEQVMMYSKAILFGDHETARKIMATSSPWNHKSLGRQVKGFKGDVWNEKRVSIVRAGALAKFRQHEDICQILLDTRGKELVEAAPNDRIWGVGLDEHSPAIKHRKLWLGLNLLGQLLEEVREIIYEERLSGVPLKETT